jgi:hypothetical protein
MSGLPIATTLLALQIFVLLVMPNKTARTLAALFATTAWIFTVFFLLWPGKGDQALFAGGLSTSHSMLGAWTDAACWVLTWVPLLALVTWLIRSETQWMSSKARSYARPLLIGVLLGLSMGGINTLSLSVIALGLDHTGMPVSWAIYALLSVGLAMTAAYGAFLVRSNALIGSAVLAALLHLANFYYFYGATLMWKSLIMAVAGAALLLGGIALRNSEARGAP